MASSCSGTSAPPEDEDSSTRNFPGWARRYAAAGRVRRAFADQEVRRAHYDHLIDSMPRVGLRYVDEITDPVVKSPTGWAGWIRDELLGPLAHSGFAAAVRGAEQHVEFDAGGGYRVVLRHGTSRIQGEQQWAYVLDHDCFRQTARALTTDGVVGATEDLHRISLQVFQAVITNDLYNYLAGRSEK